MWKMQLFCSKQHRRGFPACFNRLGRWTDDGIRPSVGCGGPYITPRPRPFGVPVDDNDEILGTRYSVLSTRRWQL